MIHAKEAYKRTIPQRNKKQKEDEIRIQKTAERHLRSVGRKIEQSINDGKFHCLYDINGGNRALVQELVKQLTALDYAVSCSDYYDYVRLLIGW